MYKNRIGRPTLWAAVVAAIVLLTIIMPSARPAPIAVHTPSAGRTTPAVVRANVLQTAVPAHLPTAEKRAYTVKRGDSLSAIAPKLGTTWQRLCRVNRLSNCSLIHVGQKLVVSGRAAAVSKPVSAPKINQNSGQKAGILPSRADLHAMGYRASPSKSRAIAKIMLVKWHWSGQAQYDCLNQLYAHESRWEYNIKNVAGGDDFGIPQANPSHKLASAGADWRVNAQTQLRWGFSYIHRSYGTPCGAWTHWKSVATHWDSDGDPTGGTY